MADTDNEQTETTEDVEQTDKPDDVELTAEDEDGGTDAAETFPREVVEKLRTENAKYRQRAGQADELAKRLHTELVRATGKLADPTDLPFDADHIADADKLMSAIDALLDAKPHLATRKPAGDIGQGQRGPATGSFSLLDMLKERT